MARLTEAFGEIASGAGCCPADSAILPLSPEAAEAVAPHVAAYVTLEEDGVKSLELAVPGMTCAACIARVERAARDVPGVDRARANFSARKLSVAWRGDLALAERIVAALAAEGYKATPFSAEAVLSADDAAMRDLLRALGVAGFATMNVMLLSISVWAGSDMAESTRSFFHWLSALIALPAVAYAGRPFYRGAFAALKSRRLNMDVPVSLAVILASAMSLYQTTIHGGAVYFDASVTLLFFLLLGRLLDLRVRAKARSAARQLLAIRARAATVIDPDGSRRFVRPEALTPGMRVSVAAGERVPADGTLTSEFALLDNSLLTGESLPEETESGAQVYAGALNLADPVEVAVTRPDNLSLLAEVGRLMEAAEQGRARYVRLADRVAQAYAPVVHVLGAATAAAWLLLGVGWENALQTGIAVLIITCPCALALAVPAVQVVAGGRMLRNGVLVKGGDALERLANIDMVVFDKTGTLTTGELTLACPADPQALALAATVARESRHPLARALVRAAKGIQSEIALRNVREEAGLGLQATTKAGIVRLGSRRWVGAEDDASDDSKAEIWLRDARGRLTRFAFADQVRVDAADTIAKLQQMGVDLAILSGDRPAAVSTVAAAVGIGAWEGACSPGEKIRWLRKRAAMGYRVFMIGDGLNDAPALTEAHASMSPSDAADIAQNAADFVSLGDRLGPVADTLRIARASQRLVFQNFALCAAYNAVAVPIAMAGLASPLIAAIAMSVSSLAVTLNALRLKWIS